MDYDIKFEDGIFFVKLSGNVDLKSVDSYWKDLFGHAQWTKGSLLLVDHRELKKGWPKHKSYDNVEKSMKILLQYKDVLEGAKIAAIYSQTSEMATDLGLYETLFKYLKLPLERQIFNDYTKALKWLKQD